MFLKFKNFDFFCLFKSLFFLLSLSTLISCSVVTTNSISKVHVTDNRNEVIKKVGIPDIIKGYYNKEILVYYVHSDIFDLFISSKFPYIGFYPLLRTGEEYWVILEDGKVASFGSAKNYKTSIPNALKGNNILITNE